jgi:hypothetical protein
MVEHILTVQAGEMAFLELHGAYPGFRRGIHKPFGQTDIPVMVDADLGNDISGLIGADQ